MNDQGLCFVPLGGAGEIGLNCYLYGQDGEWLMVDLGIGFADDTLPGVEILLPEVAFAEALGERLHGLVLTHAHEDHAGAVPYLWPRLRCPVYCTRFTAAVLRRKLEEAGLRDQVPVHVVEPGEAMAIGPFEGRLIQVTHSIPESHALALRTAHGNLLHTGDWKLDPEPLLGPTTAVDELEALGRAGVLAMIADSTNVMVPGTAGSEAEVRDSLRGLIARQPHRVVLTTFASNLARLETVIGVARELGREVALVGRSMRRMVEAAREVGYLKSLPPLLDERDAMDLPRERVLLLVTGSQGEPRAALTRIAFGQHQSIELERGDTVIFSAKIIPGNERTLYSLHNLLVRQGIEVVTERDHFVHVSGHPCRDELEQMYRWIRPRIAVPVHGESRHLHEHLLLARRLGVPEVVHAENGQVVRIAPGTPEIVDEIEVGQLVMDSGAVVGSGDERFRIRRRLMHHGTVLVGLVLDTEGSVLTQPVVTALGAGDVNGDPERNAAVAEAVLEAVERLGDREVVDDERVREAVRASVRRALGLSREQRPIIEVQISRVTSEALDGLEDDLGAA